MQNHDPLLIAVQLFLPSPVALHSDFHAAKYHFLAATKVNAELYDITVVDRKGSGLDIWLAQANMVEEGAR